jgi:hypothetical protein
MDSKDTTTTQPVTTTVLNIQTRGGGRTVSPTHLPLSLSVAGVSLGLAMGLAAVDSKELAASCFPAGRTQLMEFVSSILWCFSSSILAPTCASWKTRIYCCVWELGVEFLESYEILVP